MAADNPFAPTFGASPPVLAGRDDLLGDIAAALAGGPTHPDYTTLFIGVRGAGKTVMLNAVEDLARERGWLTLSETASPPGLIERLESGVGALLAEFSDSGQRRRISGVSAAGFGVDFDHAAHAEAPPDLRVVLSDLGDALAENGTGLLITLDELQSADGGEIRKFGTVLQHVTRREQRPVAFVGAALPQIEDSLLSDDAATFLQRCSRYDVDRLDPQATRTAIREPIAQRGAAIDPEALDDAVTATSGYAFMVQLVGFYSWEAAADPCAGIAAADVAKGIAEAEERMGRLVLSSTWRGLSDVDQRFLVAMARDDGKSRLSTIADRLEVSVNYAGVYRHRLIRVGMIVPAGRGRIDFAHHTTRKWLRSQPAYAAESFPDD